MEDEYDLTETSDDETLLSLSEQQRLSISNFKSSKAMAERVGLLKTHGCSDTVVAEAFCDLLEEIVDDPDQKAELLAEAGSVEVLADIFNNFNENGVASEACCRVINELIKDNSDGLRRFGDRNKMFSAIFSAIESDPEPEEGEGVRDDPFLRFFSFNDTLLLLLRHEARIKIDQQERCTVLHRAVEQGNRSVVLILLDNGAETDIFHPRRGTALEIAAHTGNADIVQLLLDRGAGVDGLREPNDSNYKTALHRAAMKGHTEIVRILLRRGADINADSREEGLPSTALELALCKGHNEVITLLKDAGADINRCSHEGTLLHWAVTHDKKTIASRLLDCGAYIDGYDFNFLTPLLAVCKMRVPSIVMIEFLIEKGADLRARAGPTAFDFLRPNEVVLDVHHQELVELEPLVMAARIEALGAARKVLQEAIEKQDDCRFATIKNARSAEDDDEDSSSVILEDPQPSETPATKRKRTNDEVNTTCKTAEESDDGL